MVLKVLGRGFSGYFLKLSIEVGYIVKARLVTYPCNIILMFR